MNPGAPAPSPAAQPTPAAFTPEAFGKYYLVDRIAMGGMAEIFKAKTFGVGGFENLLVIKRILSHLSENEQFVQMFMDEAKVSALLQNANIVRIYDFGKLRANYFIAMECVEGKDAKQILRKLAERRKLLPREFAVYVAMEAAKGLDYAHKRTTLQGQPLNIVHRDVSPSNLLVSYHGEVKVADFGIVKAANTFESTDVGTLKGKFEYMSPEQAQGIELDRRSDIFSLGIILWEMLTGRRAFKADSEIRTLERIRNVEIEFPSVVNPQVPARLDEIVMRALTKDPDDRYQDAREVHSDLIEFLYPASPDLTQQSLAHFMAELFSEEMNRERERLDEGSRTALAIHESNQLVDLEPDWSESAATAGGTPTAPTKLAEPTAAPRPNRIPLLLGLLTLLTAMLALAVLVLYPILRPSLPDPIVRTIEREVLTSVGALDIRISPVSARVLVDGTLAGEGTAVTVGELDPTTPHLVRVEASGYAPYEETVQLAAGERLRIPVSLSVANVAQTARPAVPGNPVSAATALRFTSNPSGADIFVDGRLVGKTPMNWGDPTRAQDYAVEYRLSGFESARFTASVTADAPTATFDRSLGERARAEGKLNVNVSGGGWGDIYVNDRKVGTTPKFGLSLAAGTYTIRVVNEGNALDRTKTVTIKAGETVTATFSAD